MDSEIPNPDNFETRFGRWVVRYRWPIIFVTLIAVVAAASGGRYLRFTNDYRVFFSKDNPQLRAFDALENSYTKNDSVVIAIAPKDGNVFTRRTLATVEWLTRKAWQVPYSIRVDSITNYQNTEAQNDELLVGDLVENAASLSDKQLKRIRAVALHEPTLVGNLVSPQGHVTSVNVTVQLPGINEATETPEVVSYVRKLAAEVKQHDPGINVYLTGMVMMNNAFPEASQHDMATLVPISFAVMLVLIAVLLRNIGGTVATMLIILFSIVTAMGLGGYLGIPLTPPSSSAPSIILTLAIASSVHILVTFLYEVRHGRDKHQAMAESLRVNLEPVFLACFTTALGFLSMNFSDAPPFRDLGNLVSMGVAASFVYAVLFLPALVCVLPLRVRYESEDSRGAMARFAEFVLRRQKELLRAAGILIVVLVAFVPHNELNDVFVHYFDKSIKFRSDSDFVEANLNGLYRIDYSLDSGAADGISDPEFLGAVAAFSDWWRQQPETMHVSTFTDTMKRLNKNMHGDDPSWYRLPESRQLAAQYLLLYEMSLPYGLDLNNQVNVDKSATRFSVTLKTMSTNELLALVDRARNWLHDNEPLIGNPEATGPSIMFAHVGQRNIRNMLGGTTFALILISLTLVVALRSVRIGLVSMIPNLVPAGMGFGLWGIAVGQVGLALSVVTGMTLGIVVDDTVHLLSKYLRARRERNASPDDAIRYAFTRVGSALWITSLVLILGFAVFVFSAFELNADMGLLTSLIIALALAADFCFLPPLLLKIEGKQDYECKPAVTSAP